jgi:hypothetical protein
MSQATAHRSSCSCSASRVTAATALVAVVVAAAAARALKFPNKPTNPLPVLVLIVASLLLPEVASASVEIFKQEEANNTVKTFLILLFIIININ